MEKRGRVVSKQPNDLSEPFFSEVDEFGNMRPERLAEHATSLELLSSWQEKKKQAEAAAGKKQLSADEQRVLRALNNHEKAMREAILLKGGIIGVAQDLEKNMTKGQDSLTAVKGLEDISSVITTQALGRTDVPTLQMLSRLFAKSSAYLRSITPTLQVEKLSPAINKLGQLIDKELRQREGAGGGRAEGYASIEEARAAQRAARGETPPEEDEEVGEAVFEEPEEGGEEKQAANGK